MRPSLISLISLPDAEVRAAAIWKELGLRQSMGIPVKRDINTLLRPHFWCDVYSQEDMEKKEEWESGRSIEGEEQAEMAARVIADLAKIGVKGERVEKRDVDALSDREVYTHQEMERDEEGGGWMEKASH
jgi:hypothetical protein